MIALALPACYGASRGAAPLSELSTAPGCRTSVALAPAITPITPAIASVITSTSAAPVDTTASGPAVSLSAGPTTAATPVSWIVSPDVSERPLLDRWCAGVGPVVTASHVDAAAPASVVSTGSLVVVTWNIHI